MQDWIETLTTLITLAYAGNSIVAACSYAPQCRKLLHMLWTDTPNKSVSLSTWGIWSYANSVAFLYALTARPFDTAFLTVASVNLFGSWLTAILTFWVYRRADKKTKDLATQSYYRFD
ncbi:hypothetical protein WKI13_02200 [Teredinibacter turnerae]|uniref:hypothetical protein n=1 Tax=Teredinibacter turnerae TaxID=2426 RepID=UPI00036C7674|nr:hypothetical protein [Teredinibacter turnerae]